MFTQAERTNRRPEEAEGLQLLSADIIYRASSMLPHSPPTFPGFKVAVLVVLLVETEAAHEVVDFRDNWTSLEEVVQDASDACDWMDYLC